MVSTIILQRSTNCAGFSIVLLTHNNELARTNTNTGQLILSAGGSAKRWRWSGRNDNAQITKSIEDTTSPVLVWTEAPLLCSESNERSDDSRSSSTYIILDGTWQEAQKMFRNGPDALRSIPRVSLAPPFRSRYTLRKNFGFVERFSTMGETDGTSNLLCTAEVVAALYLLHGYGDESSEILARLDAFQQCVSRATFVAEK